MSSFGKLQIRLCENNWLYTSLDFYKYIIIVIVIISSYIVFISNAFLYICFVILSSILITFKCVIALNVFFLIWGHLHVNLVVQIF